jgi:hypothetical protein
MEASRNTGIKGYEGVIFRRTTPQITNAGGLWTTALELYPTIGGEPKGHVLSWVFPNGSRIKFGHLQHADTVLDWQGAQIAFIGFDELTHFEEYQFWYMLSRNRTTAGLKPYIRATCNPSPDSWVYNLIEWYTGDDGFPIPERCGKLRYFIRLADNIVWGNSADEVYEQVREIPAFREQQQNAENIGIHWQSLIRSLTFIPGSIYQNKKLLTKDPAYLSNLMSLPEEEQKRLLLGNWRRSIDDTDLYYWDAVNSIFSNYATLDPRRFITVDASRFGRDLTTILVWQGWEVIRTVIAYKTEARDIVREIEDCRRYYKNIPKSRVLVDQDGVGGGTVKLGGYIGYSGGAAPIALQEIGHRENYANLKTQCCFKAAEYVNGFVMRYSITSENCIVVEPTGNRFYSTKVKVQGKGITDVRDLIKNDLRAFKKIYPVDSEKIKINTKEEQKIYLGGRSPDFGDHFHMRAYFDLMPKPAVVKIYN